MIISKTPLRVSFVGGGSDLPSYYRENGGAVVSMAINKFVYICVNKAFDQRIRISYSKTEEVLSVSDIEHDLVRSSLIKLGIEKGIEIVSIADIPSKGSGLGSSSAFTVGLLNALHSFKGITRSQMDLAHEACDIELDLCDAMMGKQDQYGVATAGLKFIRFHPDETVDVEPISMPEIPFKTLESNLLMFFTGIVRPAAPILRVQSRNLSFDARSRAATRRLAKMADELHAELIKGNADAAGELMREGWHIKKTLADGISTDFIDNIYAAARDAGATGGKLLGAGGGGFFLFYVPQSHIASVRNALAPLIEVDFCIDHDGASIMHKT
jgi:D-glycero-alpha-D-manno-heptose-7-phosphate kinase